MNEAFLNPSDLLLTCHGPAALRMISSTSNNGLKALLKCFQTCSDWVNWLI